MGLAMPLLAADELWFTDMDVAKEAAVKEGKAMIIDFTDLDN